MEWKSPLLSILGILALVVWAIDYWKLFKKPELHYFKNANIRSLGLFKLKKWCNFILGSVGLILISISLAGPRVPLNYEKNKIDANDIFIVLDVSRSMLAEDFSPNRLEAAKQRVFEFIKFSPTDRIGIIIFSEKAFTLLPLTTDLSLIGQVIEDIKVGYLGAGTNIGDAIGLAVARATVSESKKKVIILLTDGVSNVGNLTPMQAAEMAHEQGIKIYTIAIGSDNDARIPVGNGIFGKTYQYIPGGGIDIKGLEEISKITNGKSYRAQNESSLKEVLVEIEKLEKSQIEISGHIVYNEKFYKFLFWGVLLFVLSEIFKKFYLREVL